MNLEFWEAIRGTVYSYENFLDELDKAWADCARVLVPGGRICCVVGDVCVTRKREGRSREDKISAGQYVRFPVGKEWSKYLTGAGN